ncbi:hypothetical protein MRX96_014076 [Rhipicephalus microplus]
MGQPAGQPYRIGFFGKRLTRSALAGGPYRAEALLSCRRRPQKSSKATLRKVGGRCPLRGLVTQQRPRETRRSVAGGAWHHLAGSVRDVVQGPSIRDWCYPARNRAAKLLLDKWPWQD